MRSRSECKRAAIWTAHLPLPADADEALPVDLQYLVTLAEATVICGGPWHDGGHEDAED